MLDHHCVKLTNFASVNRLVDSKDKVHLIITDLKHYRITSGVQGKCFLNLGIPTHGIKVLSLDKSPLFLKLVILKLGNL